MWKIISQMYYLYRHIRLDKNEVFYIGIGTYTRTKSLNNTKSLYARAYNIKSRNNIWKKIVNKTKYEIEILIESDNQEFIKEKEIEFIKLYGRINLKTGTLSNLTDGGDGVRNIIWTEESRKKISNLNKGNIISREVVDAISTYKSKPIIGYQIDGDSILIFNSIKEAKIHFNSETNISKCLQGKIKTSNGYNWIYVNDEDKFKYIKNK